MLFELYHSGNATWLAEECSKDVSFGPPRKGGCKGNVAGAATAAMSSWYGICCCGICFWSYLPSVALWYISS